MKINNKSMQIFAMFASLIMLTVITVPMAAAETDYEYYDETQLPTPEITLYDLAGSEIEIINGLPYIIVETEDGYVNIPFPLSNTMDMIVDGVPITVEVDGNYLLIPTEDGIERVCISEFDVELIDGKLMLVHEVNPAWKGAAGGAALYLIVRRIDGTSPTATGMAAFALAGASLWKKPPPPQYKILIIRHMPRFFN